MNKDEVTLFHSKNSLKARVEQQEKQNKNLDKLLDSTKPVAARNELAATFTQT